MKTRLFSRIKDSALIVLLVVLVSSVAVAYAQAPIQPEEPLGAHPLQDHWKQKASGGGPGLTLTSTDGVGVLSKSNRTIGPALKGFATNSIGLAIGVTGASNGANGKGVFGISASSSGGTGVHGKALQGTGVYGESESGIGVYGHSESDWSGWFDNGVWISDSGSYGLQVDDAAWSGIWVERAGRDGYQVEDAGRHGLHIVNAAQHGVVVENASGEGLRVGSSDKAGVHVVDAGGDGVLSVSSGVEDAAGVHAYSVAGWHYGLFGQDGSAMDAGYGVRTTAFSNNGSDIRTNDDLFVDGTCTGCTIAYLAVNKGGETLAPGDLVILSGLQAADTVIAGKRPLLVASKLSREQADSLLVGVVVEGVPPKADMGLEDPGTTEEAIPSGGLMAVATRGTLTQIKASAAEGVIAAGDGLSASAAGLAGKARQIEVNGTQFYAPGSLLGVALEPLDDGEGLIWVLLSFQ